jgi:hypothetical protein
MRAARTKWIFDLGVAAAVLVAAIMAMGGTSLAAAQPAQNGGAELGLACWAGNCIWLSQSRRAAMELWAGL